jgi:hypothetical protein
MVCAWSPSPVDQPGGKHPFDRTVQRSGPEGDSAARTLLDILHDGVSVSVRIGERQQDVNPWK